MQWNNFSPLKLLGALVVCWFIMAFLGNTRPLLASTSDVKDNPKLIVRVVVEQMRYEMLLRYWDRFSDEGFKRIIQEGVAFQNGQVGYANAERSSGFATIATGAYPSMHGIIGDKWYNRLNSREVFCIEDNHFQAIGGEEQNAKYSPLELLASTTGDELKLLDEASKVYSIGLNPISSVMGVGRLADAAFWFDDRSANWMSNTYYLDSLPLWVRKFNDQGLEDLYMNKVWKPLLPDSSYIKSTNDDHEAEEGFLLLFQKTFPYDLNLLKEKSHSYRYLKYTPFGNTYTNDFASSLILNEQLGKDEHTDLLNIAFSSSAYVNDFFGVRSVEMEDLYLRLDLEISHLLTFLDEGLGKENVLVILTSDRGASDPYEFRKEMGLQTREFNPGHGMALLNAYLGVIFQQDEWVTSYSRKQIYLNHALIDQYGYDLSSFQEKVSNLMVKKAGIAYAIPATILQNNHFDEGMLSMIQNSFHSERSGDVLLVYEPGVIEVPERIGSIYSYDVHIPMVWWGNGLLPATIHEKVHLRDIAPTISRILNISVPDASYGKDLLPLLQNWKQ